MAGIHRVCVDSGANGGTAHIDFGHFSGCRLDPSEPPVKGCGIGFEFLPQPDGDCILELGPAHFQDGIEFHAFPGKGLFQGTETFVQIFQQEEYRQFPGCGDHVVGGLSPVYLIVGMNQGIIPFFPAQDLNGDVGDHLIGIYVERGAGASLDGILDELVQIFSSQDAVAGGLDGFGGCRLQGTGPTICQGAGFLDVSQAADHGRMGGLTGNVEIFESPERLHPIIGVPGDGFRTDGITFQTFEFLLTHGLFPP